MSRCLPEGGGGRALTGIERYQTIVQTANEGIWLIDANGRTLYVNERMATMLGHPVADFAERMALDYCFPEDRVWARERLQRTFHGQSEQFGPASNTATAARSARWPAPARCVAPTARSSAR